MHALVQIFRILQKWSLHIYKGYFNILLHDVIGHPSHNPKHLYVLQVQTNYGRLSLYFQDTMLWDNLPHCYTLQTE